MQFHTRERLVSHLKAAKRCWETITTLLPPLPPAEVARLDAEASHTQRSNCRAGLPARKADLPAYRLPGPLPCRPGTSPSG